LQHVLCEKLLFCVKNIIYVEVVEAQGISYVFIM